MAKASAADKEDEEGEALLWYRQDSRDDVIGAVSGGYLLAGEGDCFLDGDKRPSYKSQDREAEIY